MSNKPLLIGVGVIAIIILLAGGFYFLNQNNSSDLAGENNTMMALDDESDMFMGAFAGSGSVRCTYQDEDAQGVAYIKNGKVRVESSGAGAASYGNVIFKDDTVWTWETNATEGFMISNISQYQAADQGIPEGYAPDVSDIRARIAENKPECMSENIADSIFDVPTNVSFKSIDSMLEGLDVNSGNGMDSGGNSGIPSDEEIRKMMEQYDAQQ